MKSRKSLSNSEISNLLGLSLRTVENQVYICLLYTSNREKCDLVVCLSHLGWQGKPYSDETLIPNTRNIDIAVS